MAKKVGTKIYSLVLFLLAGSGVAASILNLLPIANHILEGGNLDEVKSIATSGKPGTDGSMGVNGNTSYDEFRKMYPDSEWKDTKEDEEEYINALTTNTLFYPVKFYDAIAISEKEIAIGQNVFEDCYITTYYYPYKTKFANFDDIKTLYGGYNCHFFKVWEGNFLSAESAFPSLIEFKDYIIPKGGLSVAASNVDITSFKSVYQEINGKKYCKVNRIWNGAANNLTDLVLNEGVSIISSSFSNSTASTYDNIKTIKLPKSLVVLEKGAFKNFRNLQYAAFFNISKSFG